MSDTAEIIRKPKAETPPATSERVKIILERNNHIPPNGLYIGANGRGYILQPGVVADVPRELLNVLNDAIISVPEVAPGSNQIIGYQDQMRYPYRIVT